MTMDVSLRLDDVTRQRIKKISMDRKQSGRGQKSIRKNAINASADRWTSEIPDDDGLSIMSASLHSRSSQGGGRKQAPKKRIDELSVSEHTGRSNNDTSSGDNDRHIREGDEDGKLGDFLGQINEAKPLKRQGPHTVTGATDSRETRREGSVRGGRREMSQRSERSKSPHGLRGRAQSMKKRSASPGPMKKRSESPSPMKSKRAESKKNRSESLGPMKRRSSRISKRSTGSTDDDAEKVSRPGDDSGRLGRMLLKMERPGLKKKKSSRSVSSAPALARKESRRTRKTLREPGSMRRARSTDADDPLVDDRRKSAVQPKRSKSANESQTDNNYDDSRSFSQRLSRKFISFKKMTGLGNSEATSATHQGDSSPEQAPTSRKGRAQRRESLRTGSKKKKRSTSAGPLANRPRETREDRRKGLTKSKRVQSDDNDEPTPKGPVRAQSMMLHREATRRGGKAASLKDLVQYSEEEIHSTSYFASNHVLVNRERMKRGLRPLTRNIQMDELARTNAERMAGSAGAAPIQATYVGNVLRGESIRAIHRATMLNKEGRERGNLLNPYYQEFGVGTCKGPDGMLYVCQLFSERLELTITDTS